MEVFDEKESDKLLKITLLGSCPIKIWEACISQLLPGSGQDWLPWWHVWWRDPAMSPIGLCPRHTDWVKEMGNYSHCVLLSFLWSSSITDLFLYRVKGAPVWAYVTHSAAWSIVCGHCSESSHSNTLYLNPPHCLNCVTSCASASKRWLLFVDKQNIEKLKVKVC
jgi:hypothetical protein